MTRDLCEWNPDADRPAEYAVAPTERGLKRMDEQTGCQNTAKVIVGADGQWRLCDACAALPRFNRYHTRKLIEVE